MAEARAAWNGMMPGLDASRLVFLDETWASTRMARTDGWAPRGERLVAAVPHGRWRVRRTGARSDLGGGASTGVP